MKLNISNFGGVNQADQDSVILNRAFSASGDGISQIAPFEAKKAMNLDYGDDGIIKRKGQTLYKDFTSAGLNILVSGDSLVAGILWNAPSTGQAIEVIVSKKTIYANQSGEFVQINDSASAAYTHAADVTKCTFAKLDGHLFIGLDGANHIQVYKEGADLDPEMDNGNLYEEAFSAVTHAMTGTWATGTYLLEAFQTRLFFSDGNTYVEYSPEAYTAASGIWDLGGATAGFLQAGGSIRTLTSFAPKFSNELNQTLYIGTEAGFDVTTGVSSSDVLIRVQGSSSPINHKSVVRSPNWLIYLSDDKNIYGINGSTVINLGRRLKNSSKTAVLDALSLYSPAVGTYSSAFGFYYGDKSQAIFFFNKGGLSQIYEVDGGLADTSLSATPAVVDSFEYYMDGGAADTTTFTYTVDGGRTARNANQIAIDFKLGEPVIGERQNSFEKRVRLLPWVFDPDIIEYFFIDLYNVDTGVIGVLEDGYLYHYNTGATDLASYDIESSWESIDFDGGISDRIKQFYKLQMLTKTQLNGTPSIDFKARINKQSTDLTTDSWSVLDTTEKQISRYGRLNVRADCLKWFIESQDQYEFNMYSMSLSFDIGAELLE